MRLASVLPLEQKDQLAASSATNFKLSSKITRRVLWPILHGKGL
jgi:hypothetical protein